MIKAIETEYRGYKFRSRLEARWAVFFDACGLQWDYEPEGFCLGNGLYYLPDFVLYGVDGRCGNDNKTLYVEVKGEMTDADSKKIMAFSEQGGSIYVVGRIPAGNTFWEIQQSIDEFCWSEGSEVSFERAAFFNFLTVDGDWYRAYPGINKHGKFELFGADYLWDANAEATAEAFHVARQARFEHAEKPTMPRSSWSERLR